MIRVLLILATLYAGYAIYKRVYAQVCPACGERMKKGIAACPACNRPVNADSAIEATILPEKSQDQSEYADDPLRSPLVLTLIVLTVLAAAAVAFFVHVVGKQ